MFVEKLFYNITFSWKTSTKEIIIVIIIIIIVIVSLKLTFT